MLFAAADRPVMIRWRPSLRSRPVELGDTLSGEKVVVRRQLDAELHGEADGALTDQ
jgi:hypothetical protein